MTKHFLNNSAISLLAATSLAWAAAPANEIVDGGWELVGAGYKFTEGPACDEVGDVFFTDIPANRIYKINLEGKVSLFVEQSGGANGLMFGPNGKLYACQDGKKRIVAYDPAGREEVVAEELSSNDLVVSHKGWVYVTDPEHHQVWSIAPDGTKKVADTGLVFPNGVRLTADQAWLVVADTKSQYVYSYRVEDDGSLSAKQKFYRLAVPDGTAESGADGMTLDIEGRLYVATKLGVQVCDQAGRVNVILPKPQDAWLANVVFGGSGLKYLYATCGDKVYRRKTKTKGVLFFQEPILPPKPRL